MLPSNAALRNALRNSERAKRGFARWLNTRPEAIVVFDGDTGRFLFGNSHTCRLYGIPPEKLEGLGPLDVSPEFQPDGRRTEVVAREKMDEALAGGTPIFEWMHRHPNGKMVPAEVRLVRLPGQDKNLLRASIIDTTERKRREKAQQAIYDISEAIHTTEDLNSLFQQIHYTVKELMPAENFYIALADVNSQTIDFPYMVDENGINARPLQMGEGLTGYVLRTGKALLAGPHNAEDLKNGVCVVMEGTERVTATNCGSSKALVWLGAPLTVRGQTFGVIAVQDYHNPHAFGEHDKQILTFVASQIALAIERKRANQALLESEHKFRALFAASSQGVMLHDEKEYLEVNPAAARILAMTRPLNCWGAIPAILLPPFNLMVRLPSKWLKNISPNVLTKAVPALSGLHALHADKIFLLKLF